MEEERATFANPTRRNSLAMLSLSAAGPRTSRAPPATREGSRRMTRAGVTRDSGRRTEMRV